MTTQPNRTKHLYTQTICGTPEQIFPLLCPVREHDWVPGWTTDWIISASGYAEKDCIFQTPPRANEKSASIWIITHHAAEEFAVEMCKVTPEQTVGKLEISLQARDATTTNATISYEFTSLGPDGDTFLEGFTAEWYEDFMRGWESAMNQYLKTTNRY